ncbi:uncharacterized protein F5Z01DRAFT_496447 [Emericellopsis atlantica]|uniref:Uncharacterized protein n=1 Tax=Emericellopsis atlantica TaxID=2614577 RepID=A0A9P8CJG0_9HYPO|nr:uncharacterized protein F5Z01DRAFT_496447 [Emericellopsis atlantica]KAG9249434.1 hypothetical protein F5Z01DRAFT_496447 [Emericellopsis atlantica]
MAPRNLFGAEHWLKLELSSASVRKWTVLAEISSCSQRPSAFNELGCSHVAIAHAQGNWEESRMEPIDEGEFPRGHQVVYGTCRGEMSTCQGLGSYTICRIPSAGADGYVLRRSIAPWNLIPLLHLLMLAIKEVTEMGTLYVRTPSQLVKASFVRVRTCGITGEAVPQRQRTIAEADRRLEHPRSNLARLYAAVRYLVASKQGSPAINTFPNKTLFSEIASPHSTAYLLYLPATVSDIWLLSGRRSAKPVLCAVPLGRVRHVSCDSEMDQLHDPSAATDLRRLQVPLRHVGLWCVWLRRRGWS